MKKLLAMLLALILVFSLTACGGTEAPKGGEEANKQAEENNQQQEEIQASSKTMAFFLKYMEGGSYTMEMKTTYDGIESVVKSAYKDDMIYTESEYEGMKSCMIMKDGYQYILDHSTKTCMQMSVINNDAVQEMFAEEAANYETPLATGQTEYNGKSYDYEEFAFEDETIQYLFDGNDLKFIKAMVMGTESVVEIISIEKGADDSLFEVPEDYQVISY